MRRLSGEKFRVAAREVKSAVEAIASRLDRGGETAARGFCDQATLRFPCRFAPRRRPLNLCGDAPRRHADGNFPLHPQAVRLDRGQF